jgi:hypothetical protein
VNVVHVKGGGFAVPNDLAGIAGIKLGKTLWNLPKKLARLFPYGQKAQTSCNGVTRSFPQAHREWTSPAEKQRLQSRFHWAVDPGGIEGRCRHKVGILSYCWIFGAVDLSNPAPPAGIEFHMDLVLCQKQ